MTPDIGVAEQVKPYAIPRLKEKGFTAIIDLRPDGLGAEEILAAVRRAGQSADDLEAAIHQRIARRNRTTGATP